MQREELERLTGTGQRVVATITYAHLLLKADVDGPDAWSDERIAQALEVGPATVAQIRKQFVQQGLAAAIHRKRPTGREYR